MAELMVVTIRQLAECIVSRINTEVVLRKPFPNCDYGIIDVDGETEFDQEELEFLHSGICGWYGIKQIHAGFDSYNLCAVADYYGGGCAAFLQLCDGIPHEDAVGDVADAIRSSLRCQEEIDDNTTLLVEFLEVG